VRRQTQDIAARRLASRSPLAFAFFGRVFAKTLRRGFHAMRMAGAAPAELKGARKLVLYANHPSWWDGVVYVMLARLLMPGRPVYTPIDAAMLTRYPFLARIGAFGVDQASARGAAEFLATSRAALAADAPLIVAAQGRFADVRERPLRLRPGLAHLVDVEPELCLVPLAIEYVFWDEKQPEMLIRFGAPMAGRELAGLPVPQRLAILEQRLTQTLDELSAAAISRDASRFEALLDGARGVNPIYDGWRRLKAGLSGKSFSPEHGARET
jgi:1-acyl-sn-glycerol-3-phosphate acyltransferase